MDYLEAYLKHLKRRNYSEATLIHYKSDLELLGKSSQKSWDQMSREDVEQFIDEQTQQEFKPKTINRRLYAIDSFYHYLNEVLQAPFASPVRRYHFIREGRKLPPIMHDQEVKALLSTIKTPRDEAIIGLMLYCGLRVGEVSALKLEDVDLFSQQVRFVGKGNRERVVPIPDNLMPALIQCLKQRPKEAPHFFWNKKQPTDILKINSIQRLLKRYAQKAQVSARCHLLRHTFARKMTESGVDRTVLRDLLGHAKMSTSDVYGKLSDPFIRDEYFKAMERIMKEK